MRVRQLEILTPSRTRSPAAPVSMRRVEVRAGDAATHFSPPAMLGDVSGALNFLRGAFARGSCYGVELHADVDVSLLSSDERYRELLRPKGRRRAIGLLVPARRRPAESAGHRAS